MSGYETQARCCASCTETAHPDSLFNPHPDDMIRVEDNSTLRFFCGWACLKTWACAMIDTEGRE